MTPPRLRMTTLGEFKLYLDGRPIEIGNSKTKALLAFLCLTTGRVYTREYLADLLWGESGLDKSRHSLNQALYSIRRLIPEVLCVTKASVTCVASVSTDVSEISELLKQRQFFEVTASLRGEFLQDLALTCGEEFDQWRSAVNRDFFSRTDDKLSQEIEASANLDYSHDGPINAVLDLLPLTAAAIARAPTPIIRHDAASNGQPPTPGVAKLPFVGRRVQLAQLAQAWQSAQSGRAQFKVIVGEPGHGKTRLANEFIDRLDNDNIVLPARCYESEKGIGFSVATQLIGLAMKKADTSGLGAIWVETIRQILPSGDSDLKPLPTLSAAAAQIRLFEAIRHLIEHLALATPVIIFVDDAQWCDKSTQQLFAYLSHRLQDSSVLVIVTSRPRVAQGTTEAVWSEWQKITVEELSTDDIAAAVKEVVPANEMPDPTYLKKLTGGNAYFLAEVIRQLRQGARHFDNRARSRIAHDTQSFIQPLINELSRDAQRCLAALSVCGRPIPINVLRVVSRVPDVEAALAALVSSGFASSSDTHISLRHDLVRHAVYARLPALVRSELHLRIGKVVSRSEARAGEAAQHFFKGRRRSLAHKYALIGVEQSDKRYATAESITLLRLAIKADPQSANAVRPMLIDRLYRAHRFAEAREEIRRHLTMAVPKTDHEAARLRLLDVDLARELGMVDGSTLRSRIESLKQIADPTDRSFMAAALRAQARSAFHDGVRRAMEQTVEALRSFAAVDPTSAESCETMAMAARIHSVLTSSAESSKWLEGVLPYVPTIADHERRLRIRSSMASVIYESGDLARAIQMHRDMLAEIDAIGAMSIWPLAASHLHMLLVEQGSYDEASAFAKDILVRATGVDAIHTLIVLHANTASMYLNLGDYTAAEVSAKKSFDQLARTESSWLELGVCGVMGLCALENGKTKEASAFAERATAILERTGFRACDVSHCEILQAKIRLVRNQRVNAVNGLVEAIEDYTLRDVVCRLRMQCELAYTLKPIDRHEARRHAKEVYEKASAIGARPIADRADSLLHRL